MRARLEIAANIALIAACALVIATVASRFIGQRATMPEPYQVGDVVPAIGGFQYSASDRTVLLFVRSTCPYCTISMPFYQTLVDSGKATNERDYRVVAVSHEPEETVHAYFAKHNVAVDELLSIATGATAVTRTPTLLVVDAAGRVLGSWTGHLTSEREAEVRLAIGKS